MKIIIFLAFVVGILCYEKPIVIETNISYSCHFAFDQVSQLIWTSDQYNIHVWDLDGSHINNFSIPKAQNRISCITADEINTQIIVAMNDTTIYFYNVNGKILSILPPSMSDDYNYNFVVFNQNTGYFYLVFNGDRTVNVLSYDSDHDLLGNKTVPIANVTIVSELSIINVTNGELIMATDLLEQCPFLVVTIDTKATVQKIFELEDCFPITAIILFNETYLGIDQDDFNIYASNGQFVKTFNYHAYMDSLRLYQKYDLIYYINIYDNDTIEKNVPIITMADLDGKIIEQLYYENNDIFGFHNINVRISEISGTIIGSIDNEIKIWKP
jgi:WD40 repeat protein